MITPEEIRNQAGVTPQSESRLVLDIPPAPEQPQTQAEKHAPFFHKDASDYTLQDVNEYLEATSFSLLLGTDVQEHARDYQQSQLQPWIDATNRAQALADTREKEREQWLEDNKPDWLSSTVAMLESENMIAAHMAHINVPKLSPKEGYTPFDDPQVKGLERFSHLWYLSVHPDETAAIASNIRNELRNQDIIARTGVGMNLATGLLAGLGSPINLVGMAATPAIAAKTIGTAASAGKTIAFGAGAGATMTAIDEVLLHGPNDLRTLDESALNVVANLLLDTTLGSFAAGARTLGADWEAAKAESIEYLRRGGSVETLDEFDLSAAETRFASIDMGGASPFRDPIRWAVGQAALKMSKVTPLGRMLQAEVGQARELILKLAETNVRTTGEYGYVSIESRIMGDIAQTSAVIGRINALQVKARQEYGMTADDFATEYYYARRRNDIHDNPLVQEAVQLGRSISQPLFKTAADYRVPGTFKEVKTFNPDTRKMEKKSVPAEQGTAESYAVRHYDIAKATEGYKTGKLQSDLKEAVEDARVRSNDQVQSRLDEHEVNNREKVTEARNIIDNTPTERKNLQAAIRNYETAIKGNSRKIGELKKTAPNDPRIGELEARIKSIEKNRKAVVRNIKKLDRSVKWAKGLLAKYNAHRIKLKKQFIDEYTEGDLNAFAESFYESIAGLKPGDIHANVGARPSILKQRVPIRDVYVEKYLQTDWRQELMDITNALSPRIHLMREFGEIELTKTIANLSDNYSARITAAIQNGDKKRASKLGKERDLILHDAKLMRDRLLGRFNYGDPNDTIQSIGRSLLNLNVTRLLNGQAISSIPEVAKIPLKFGMTPFIRALGKGFKDIRLGDVPADEGKRLGSAATRMATVKSAMAIDVIDVTPSKRWEKATQTLARATYLVSLQQHFDSVFKGMAGMLSVDAMSRMIRSGDIAGLNKLGFTGLEAKIMQREFAKFGRETDGLWALNSDRWNMTAQEVGSHYDPRELQSKIYGVIMRDANSTIIRPGIGDRPAAMDKITARLLLQFKSFIVAATNRTMLPISQSSGDFWKHTTVMSALGLIGYYAYMTAAGREIDWSDEDTLVREALNRGGYLGYATDAYLTSEKVFGFGPATSRYQSRSQLGALLGPTFGTATDIAAATYVGRDPSSGEYYSDIDARIHAMRKLMPFQNHFAFRRGIDFMEGEAAKALGGEGRFGGQDKAKPVTRY